MPGVCEGSQEQRQHNSPRPWAVPPQTNGTELPLLATAARKQLIIITVQFNSHFFVEWNLVSCASRPGCISAYIMQKMRHHYQLSVIEIKDRKMIVKKTEIMAGWRSNLTGTLACGCDVTHPM